MFEKYLLGLLAISVLEINNVISQLAHMRPNGPIFRNGGETVEITCTLDNLRNYNIDDLEFSYSRKLSVKNSTETTEIIPIGNDTKLFRILNPSMLEAYLDCMVRGQGADRTIINIGTAPKRVFNFKCRSYNWENLTCSFERPYNPVTVNYTLYYTAGIGETHFKVPVNICNLKPNFNRIFTCSIGFQSDSPYRQSYDFYFFRLVEQNVLDTVREDFTIDHFNIVIPNPPENVNATNITSKSVVLSWKISAIFEHFPKHFVYMINYTSEFQKDEWIQLGPFSESNKHDRELNNIMSHALTNLPYANTWYDCRVSLKVRDAENTAEMWSNYSTHVFKTEPRIPDRPPLTDIGSFSFTDSGHVFVYWQELLKSEHNGPNFKYVIVGPNNTNLNVERTLTKLEHIDANMMSESLNFHIYSKNDVGKSTNYTVVNIPAIRDRFGLPTLIKKIRVDNETYNISWVAPTTGPKVTSYTVFWCEPNNESPTDCKSSIYFKRVDSDVLSYRLKTNHSMNFAISANFGTSSSGMVWAMCTVLPGNEINKLTSIITVRVQSTSIEFKWSLQCIDRTILTGYILEYCPIKDPKTEDCKEPARSHNITAMAKEYKLEHLKPYTTYSVRIRMLSDNSIGPWSEPQVNTTLEAAPTPPLNLRYHNITNTSVELTWDAPEAINGVLVRYEISCNGRPISVEKNQGTQLPFLLSNLQSFTEYEVVIKACTVLCSDSSNPIVFNTSIGQPGVIAQPKIIDWAKLVWKPPAIAGGRLEYYDVQVVYTNNGRQVRTIPINGTTCHFTKEFRDIFSEGQFDYSVRAVNVLQSPHYKSNYVQRFRRDVDIDSKAESNLFRRHSKPEIDADSQSLNLNQHEPSEPIEPESSHQFKHYGASSSQDLSRIQICEEENDQALKNYLKADKWPTYFRGPYSVSFTHQMNSHFDPHRYLYPVVLLFIFTIAFIYATFFGFKKLKRMKDISVELPEGLEDIKEESKAKHLDGGITRGEIGRSIDYQTSNEQENDPLVRFRMESASTASSENSQSEYNEGMDSSIDYETNIPEDSMQSGSDNLSNEQKKQSPPTPLIPMQREPEIIQNPTPPSPLLQMSSDRNQFHDSSYTNRPSQFQKSFIQQPGNAMSQLTSNGYVTHDAVIGKPNVSSGYTPWSVIDIRERNGKSNPSQTEDTKAKTPIITSSDLKGISGYVTHKQLSDFGQLMH